MNIIVEVNSSEATDFEFAKVNLNYLDQGKCYKLDIDFSTLYKECGKPTSKIMDFLFISSIIYSVDKIVSREDAHDNWTRNLYVEIPVSNLNEWNKVKEDFIEMINFLTGDKWDINFKKLKSNLDRINNDVEYIPLPFTDKEKAVSLFSGGLDSLTGVIDWLENYSERLILVGHYDPQVAGPKSDQQKIYNKIKSHYQDRTRFLQIKLGQRPYPTEGTYRSRSLVFLALGIYAANSLGENIPLIIPENGTIALNIPLTPSRRGACSTRTTHPFFLDKVRHVLTKLEVNNPIRNPFQLLTKGECLERCKNLELLKELSLLSVSCGKRGHVREWKRRNANGCGRCIPCIFRRAALHKINYDIESYGLDFCAGEVDIDNTKKAGNNDIRACISFLNNNYSKKDIKDLLSSSGGLKVNELDIYSEVVYKAMKEVKELVKNKAIDDIKDRIVYLND